MSNHAQWPFTGPDGNPVKADELIKLVHPFHGLVVFLHHLWTLDLNKPPLFVV